MSTITRTYTFTDGTTAYGSQVDSEVANIVNTWNNHDAGTSTWTMVKATNIRAADGTVAAPSISFSNSTGSGMYLQSSTLLSIAVGGLQNILLDTSQTIQIGDGTVGGPGLRFIADNDTGVYRPSANVMGLVAGGTEYFEINAGSPFVFFVNMNTTTGASTATLTNSPVAGNPPVWMQVKVNGTARYIPCW